VVGDGWSEIEILRQQNPAEFLRVAVDVHVRRVPAGVIHRGPAAQLNRYGQTLLRRERDLSRLVLQAPGHFDLALPGWEEMLFGAPAIGGCSRRKDSTAPALKIGPGRNRLAGLRVFDSDLDFLSEGGAAKTEAKQCNRTNTVLAVHAASSPSTARFYDLIRADHHGGVNPGEEKGPIRCLIY
jgi:hypothetical protein